MIIAIDARTMGSRPSGVGMYLNDFLRELMKYSEFQFVLLSDVDTSENIQYFADNGIEVRTQGREVYKSVDVYSYFKFIQKQLDDIKPDVFWEVNTIIPVKLKGSFRIMITIHDMFPIEHIQYFGYVYSIYFRYNLKKTLQNTDMILYNSKQTKDSTERMFKEARNIKNCNAYIISNPLERKYKIKDEGYFLYVGNMEKRKGVDLMIKAYVRYRAKGGLKPMIFAGKMQEEDIRKLLESTMSTVRGITYLDYVSQDKKMELFSNCSCFLFPSKAEGFGMPILEVMKFYKPIIVGNLDIYKEIVGPCVNTFDLKCDEAGQMDNLSSKMLDYSPDVDREQYYQVVRRYLPENLGKKVRDFILKGFRSKEQ